MRISDVARPSAMLVAVALSACAGSQPGAMPPGAPGRAALGRDASHQISWMGKGVKQQDLLYVSNTNGVVNVYRYWQHTLVGVLTKFTDPLGECTDAAGNVYIVDAKAENVTEYAHGGTKALKTLADSPYMPFGCAVNQATGDVAVANYSQDSYEAGNIAVYSHGSAKPTFYSPSRFDHFVSCAYDKHGNLFTTSQYGYSSYYDTDFYYLPNGGTALRSVTLPGPSKYWEWDYVEAVSWDGHYWIALSDNDLYRYIINVKAYYVSTVDLSDDGYVHQIAFYHPLVRSKGMEVVGAAGSAEYWDYPAGGNPVAQITKGLDAPYGIAISLGTQ